MNADTEGSAKTRIQLISQLYHSPQIIRRFGLKPEECYFIDDLPMNIEGAKACGMDGHCFADGSVENLRKDLEKVLS